jgi:hypothetical protein
MMVKIRKHKLVVELTFDDPITAKGAIGCIRGCLDGSEGLALAGARFEIKRLDKVLAAEKGKPAPAGSGA